jgi:pimeloyl-ACP methyl ester carboxylesterase
MGVINFAGGRGGRPETNPGEPCRPDKLESAVRRFAKTINVPVLWVYSENDRYFSPRHVQDMYQAFKDAGATGRLVMEPPFGKNGHKLFPSKGGETFAQLTSNFNFFILIFTAINCSYSKLTY